MTKRERAQVVELLRLAANSEHAIFEAADRLCYRLVLEYTEDAFDAVCAEMSDDVPSGDEGYNAMCLEAALRVERGDLP